jgi:hypothetical protein
MNTDAQIPLLKLQKLLLTLAILTPSGPFYLQTIQKTLFPATAYSFLAFA